MPEFARLFGAILLCLLCMMDQSLVSGAYANAPGSEHGDHGVDDYGNMMKPNDDASRFYQEPQAVTFTLGWNALVLIALAMTAAFLVSCSLNFYLYGKLNQRSMPRHPTYSRAKIDDSDSELQQLQ
mmetsp:Transcript_30690/g.49229  ORF Transcript_30690/g.49229 Transcript_30690/m.49229 type:complete len:126 (-) Transcript_30690:106-483(-)